MIASHFDEFEDMTDVNTDLFQGCDLIKLYIEVNSQIKGNKMIRAVTRSLERMRDFLQYIEVDIT
jgi:hypothetical protein